MNTVDALIDKVFEYNTGANADLLRRAYAFSNEVHFKQKRKEGTPYIEHPLAVAAILCSMRLDINSLAAGLLHDTIEDTDTTVEDIRGLFGEDIAFLVESLTKLGKMEFKTSEDVQAENFRKMFLAMAEDTRVILIKFADRLHNMRTLEYLSLEKREKISRETMEIYVPLANRLGIGWLKSEFEDLSFRFLMPDVYNELIHKVVKKREEQEGYLYDVVKIVEAHMRVGQIPVEVFGRVKHLYGIYQKMQRQRIPFELVYDVIAVRIITDTKANCYAALGLIHSLWTPVPGRFKDFIGAPKSNLYQSLHSTLIGPKGERVEFQIRTGEMNRIAEEGIAAHWKYKEKDNDDRLDNKYFSWMRDLVKAQKDTPDAREFMEAVKGDIVPGVVFVFTPEGDIVELPQDATPVDFAYSIHTEVGHQCTGAKVNRKIVPLRYKLQNADTIEIITSHVHAPSRDWLKFVKTQKANARIKQWLKTEERAKGIKLGEELLEKGLRRYGLSPKLAKSGEMLEAAASLRIKSHEDLFVAIGYGRVSVHKLIHVYQPDSVKENEEKVLPKEEQKKEEDSKGISIKGVDNIMFHRSKCCYPLPGERVTGFVTRGRGVSIHIMGCHTLSTNTIDADRLVEVDWSGDSTATYSVKIQVMTVDKRGLLAELTAVLSTNNVNISHLDASSTSNKEALFNFILEIRDRKQLDNIAQKIGQINGVIGVKRLQS
ncbi:MAG: bifunctional (p)ppGpp synthetase/guanosine-3',5'-bis(diphosphate) 3'-pyrophosphohydrolase [Nitrospira sp.]|nr:bifunctional (p)ppGpp synthetase/guanosine-3',5'-bis(diphosphate) 3'-pyrophosphohydrolase [bacterium]MBL7048802.1 bifunctional (p)ppGpp synthetase/guanosine-3',5'-bis(diphosphate) 3'-pyrophosphohydrolase [Nitrospira sp.]